MSGPRRTTPTVEESPRLDVPRLLKKLEEREEGGERTRSSGSLRLRFGVRCAYRVDRAGHRLALRIGALPWWNYQLRPKRKVSCPRCSRPAELLFWTVSRGDAHRGDGLCRRCAGVRWLGGYLTGSRASTGRRFTLLRAELRAGNHAGVLEMMARDPSWWLAGRQAFEAEGILPRQYTLTNGNIRRWSPTTTPQTSESSET